MQPKPLKPRACRACSSKFTPARSFEVWCSIDCGTTLALEKIVKAKQAKAAKERKAERADTVRRKQAAKRLPDLIAEAQTAFNLWIRTRDADKPCICCGKPFEPNKPGGSMDAGHYLSRGSAPQHRFTEDNCFAQRKNCNRPGGSTRAAFRAGVIERIGIERVEALEADNAVYKWTRDELIAIKAKYAAMARDLKKMQS